MSNQRSMKKLEKKTPEHPKKKEKKESDNNSCNKNKTESLEMNNSKQMLFR